VYIITFTFVRNECSVTGDVGMTGLHGHALAVSVCHILYYQTVCAGEVIICRKIEDGSSRLLLMLVYLYQNIRRYISDSSYSPT
jgi:hypothetical protein